MDQQEQLLFQHNFTLPASSIWRQMLEQVATSHNQQGHQIFSHLLQAMAVGTSSS
jgi:hypothetical protein